MKRSIELLINKLRERHVSKHVICPTANILMPNLKGLISNPIEIIDERSAGYVATGMCEELDEPVVIWCADNDSYRNLTPALTEAYYRKLPILVVAIACDGRINQATNPQDTVRYYVNNSIIGSRGTLADIEQAMEYLYTKVKGPVYLSLGLFADNPSSTYQTVIDTKKMDITTITDLFPPCACVHIGSCFSCNSGQMRNVLFRTNHITIDGNLSMLIGSSVVAPQQLHIGVFTSDEIVYDLNMFGNRHIGNNLVVICISQNEQRSAIYGLAQRMQWNCKKIRISEIETVKSCFVTSEKPQYIEVAL